MIELPLVLTLADMRDLLAGARIVCDHPVHGLRVVVQASREDMANFKDTVNASLLAHLPTPTAIN